MSYNTVYDNGTKLCSVCKLIKPITDFYSNKSRSTKVYSSCKVCFKPTLEYPKVTDFEIVFSEQELKDEMWVTILIDKEPYPYRVSNLGRVFSVKNNMICKYSFDQRGYPQVVIYGKKRVSRRVHRLVALTFIPNPQNKREVNHKDGDKLNPRSTNLEWATSKENTSHAFKTNLRCN
jgi:hypothetical protein